MNRKTKSAPYCCIAEPGRWTAAVLMFDRLRGPINIVTLERFAPTGNTVSPGIYQGASHQGGLNQTGFVLQRVQFVWTLSQLQKSQWGFTVSLRPGAPKRVVMLLSLPLTVRRKKHTVRNHCPLEKLAPAHTLTDRNFFVKVYICNILIGVSKRWRLVMGKK